MFLYFIIMSFSILLKAWPKCILPLAYGGPSCNINDLFPLFFSSRITLSRVCIICLKLRWTSFQDIIHLGSMYWEYPHVTNAKPEAWMESECCTACGRAGKWPNQNSETLNTSPSPKTQAHQHFIAEWGEWHIEHSHMLNICLQNIRKKCSSKTSVKDTTY